MTSISRRQAVLGGAAGFALASTVGAKAGQVRTASPATKAATDPMSLVDPELRPFLKRALAPKPGAPPVPPRPARYRPDVPPPSFASSPRVERRMVPGLAGQPPVAVYLIGEPNVGGKRPAILHMHGGGYVAARAADVVPGLQLLAKRLGCLIATVDYRLAPETRLAGSLADNYAALQWLHGEASALGVDPARIAIAGESAGGGHAAMLAITARSRNGPAICAQVLTYPMLDDSTGSARPVPPFIGTYVWQPEDNIYGWSSLLGIPAGSSRVPSGVIPARVEQLDGLPQTFIAVGSIDLFVGEDIEYARRLTMAGVPTDLRVYPGAFHGFDMFVPDAWCSRDFEASRDHFYRRAFA